MTTVDWLWLVHPALAVGLVYPLVGAAVHLAHQTRQRRLQQVQGPASSGAAHTMVGRWLATGVVAIELIAFTVVILTKEPSQLTPGRSGLLMLVLGGAILALAALWRVRRAAYRASFALLCWVGVIGLGLQPEIWRVSDNPLDPAFWHSHHWGGMGLTGLLLLALAAQPEIQRQLRWRRLHLTANGLAALIFIAQGITGPRDLLEIPLSWQKATIGGCDVQRQVWPPVAPPPAAEPPG